MMDNICFPLKVREQMEVERRRGEAELRGEIRREVDKLREEVAEVQVITLSPYLVQMSTTNCILITPWNINLFPPR